MTLIVSIRTVDGIVLAGDSLSTMLNKMNYQTNVEIELENGKKQVIPVNIPMPPMPSTTFSYALKVFPIFDRFGIGIFGVGLLLGKSIYYIVREYELERLSKAGNSLDPQKHERNVHIRELAESLGDHMHNKLREQLLREGTDIDTLPLDSSVLGFQVVGYDENEPKTLEVHLGKVVRINEVTNDPGCTISGQKQVAQAIWSLYKDNAQIPAFDVFSLQDAIEYAEFLIEMTSKHQQFSRVMPSVGGDIDIALITPFNHFQWIRQKELSKKMMGYNHG